MESEKIQQAKIQDSQDVLVADAVKPSQEVLTSALHELSRFGGFNFLESSVDGIQNLNPERKARKKIFLTDEQKAAERSALRSKIDLWIDLLSNSESTTDMLEVCKTKGVSVADKLQENQLQAVNAVRSLEQSYRAVMLFYKNTELEKVSNITLVNASRSEERRVGKECRSR